MMALAALVFVWPLLRAAPGEAFAESIVAAENAFAAFIVAETVFVPLEAWLGDRAPRGLLGGAGLALVAVGTLAGARAPSAHAQVAWCALGGVGAGLAYGATVAKALRRFTDRKALCAGVTAAACAGVLALGLVAFWALTRSAALPVLVVLGAAQAVVIVVATLFILYPTDGPPPPEW
jgi:OFA family oxalate/formate antiporter-like MFS transporter